MTIRETPRPSWRAMEKPPARFFSAGAEDLLSGAAGTPANALDVVPAGANGTEAAEIPDIAAVASASVARFWYEAASKAAARGLREGRRRPQSESTWRARRSGSAIGAGRGGAAARC